jgi:hypothetical protein
MIVTAGSSAGPASLTLAAGRWLLRLTPLRRPPDVSDGGAADGLRVEVLVHASPFFGAFLTEASREELRALRRCLTRLAAGPSDAGPVRQTFALRAGTLRLDLALAPGGALTVAAELRADPDGATALRTATEADPGDLPQWVAALDALLAADSPPPSTD